MLKNSWSSQWAQEYNTATQADQRDMLTVAEASKDAERNELKNANTADNAEHHCRHKHHCYHGSRKFWWRMFYNSSNQLISKQVSK